MEIRLQSLHTVLIKAKVYKGILLMILSVVATQLISV
jgi:hypothetical protein